MTTRNSASIDAVIEGTEGAIRNAIAGQRSGVDLTGAGLDFRSVLDLERTGGVWRVECLD